MSGFAGIMQLDGAPVDRLLVRCMTAFLRFRGPDAQQAWIDGAIGLGQAVLRTTPESQRETGPCTLDGAAWIAADARLDARAELIAAVQARGGDVSATATDPELILHAYGVWGESCLEHMLGDFSFALWDRRSRRLFCARDRFGVKPFFYALQGGCLTFSNTLDCVRLQPAVTDELNDRAIADFLLFDYNADLATTAFADIQRLPPAHSLTCSGTDLRLRRYWSLPACEPLEYKRRGDYVEQFRELLEVAVADRLRTDRAGVLMGGGLDSTTVAATAHAQLSRLSGRFDLRAYTQVYDRLIPHQERRFAGMVAEALRIPIHFLEADRYRLFERSSEPELRRPEPVQSPLLAAETDQLRQISQHSRVALTGYGGDPALACLLSSHARKRLRQRQFASLLREFAGFLMAEGRLSRLYLRSRLGRWMGMNRWRSNYPVWLNEGLAQRLALPARWEQMNRSALPEGFVRPEAAEALLAPLWPALFEEYDPGVTGLPVEVRHPFFDQRLITYLLALPALPWCSDKELLRAATRGVLPDPVRLRPKSPLRGDPVAVLLARTDSAWVDRFEPAPALARYVVRSRIPAVAGEKDAWQLWVNLRPLSLNNWLQLFAPIKYKFQLEEEDCEADVTQVAQEGVPAPSAARLRRYP
jgi:asparagine synthase (glutamine-hydrolysing)